MDNKVKLATGAGLLAVLTALGVGSWGWFKNSPEHGFSTPSPTTLSQSPVSTSTVTRNIPDGSAANASPSAWAPVDPATNGIQSGIPLQAQSGIYAPVPASSVTERVTTTTTKTAFVQPSTVHHVYVRQRVRYEEPGNIHVVRALKHTIAFTAKFPFRLRF